MYHERSNVIKGDLHVVYNVTRTSFIRPLIIEVQIAGRNGILVEFYYLKESNFRVIAMSLCIEMGGAFSENYNLILSFYN